MVGVCLDCGRCGFDNSDLCYHWQEPYDFIILVGGEKDSVGLNTIVGDIRLKKARPGADFNSTKKKESGQKHKFRREPRGCRNLSGKNSSTKCHLSKKFLQTKNRRSSNFSNSKKHKQPRKSLFTSEEECISRNVCRLNENKKLLDLGRSQSHSDITKIVLGKNKSENSTRTTENIAWFDLLKPHSAGWNFECDDETLFKSLKNMSASSDKVGLDGLVVSYDTCPLSNKKEQSHEGDSKTELQSETFVPQSPPYDPLYECAFEFARTHGYGFVEFVPEEDYTMGKWNARRLRKKRELRRKKCRRRLATGYSLDKQDTNRHPLHIRAPAYSNNLKFGSTTSRGLCGGRHKIDETFRQDSSLDSTIDSMMKDMNEVQRLSKDIREALSADKWLNVSPECREQIRAWFRHEKQPSKKKKNKIPTFKRKTSPQHSFNHPDERAASKLRISRTGIPRHLSCPPSPRTESVLSELKGSTTLLPKNTLSRSRSVSSKSLQKRTSLRQVNQVLIRKGHSSHLPRLQDFDLTTECDESNNLRENEKKEGDDKDVTTPGGCLLESACCQSPQMAYRSLVREMCTMMEDGFLRVWPSDQACRGEALTECTVAMDSNAKFPSSTTKVGGRNEKTQKKSNNLAIIPSCCSKTTNTKAYNNCVEISRDVKKKTCKIITDGQPADSWLPGVMSKQTNAHYRLCNSLSATIFREAQLYSTSLFNQGCNQLKKRLSVSPVEVVYVEKNNKLENSAKHFDQACEGSQEEEADDFTVLKQVSHEDHGNKTYKRVENNTCLDISKLENKHPTTEEIKDEVNTKDLDDNVESQAFSSTRCVRLKHNKCGFPSQLHRASILGPGQHITRSGLRADSCPNLTNHTSKMHRFPPSEHSLRVRKSMSPSPTERVYITSSLLKNSTNQVSPKTVPNSAEGDWNVAQGEDSSKTAVLFPTTSPDCNTTLNKRYCPIQTNRNDAELWAERPIVLQSNTSPYLAKKRSPRRKCAGCIKNAPMFKHSSLERSDCLKGGLKYPTLIQTDIGVNNNKVDENQSTNNVTRSCTINAGKGNLKSRSESSLPDTAELNVNNNADSDNFSSDDTSNNKTPLFEMYCSPISQPSPKVDYACSQNSLASLFPISVNNNARRFRDSSPDKAQHVAAVNRRRKWGPVIESPKYQECNHSPERSESCQKHEILKLPALPTPCRQETFTKPSLDTDHGLVSPSASRACHLSKFSRYESISVGFGAGQIGDDDETNDNYLGWWEKKPTPKGKRAVSLPSANASSQPNALFQRHAQYRGNSRQNVPNCTTTSPMHAAIRHHPLNKSYVISSDKENSREPAGDNVLHLPSAVPSKRNQQQGSSSAEESEQETKKNVPRLHLSMERLELPACPTVPVDKISQFDLTPNPSLRSPEFSCTSSSNTTRRTWTSLNFSTDPKGKTKANTNNSNMLPSLKAVYMTKYKPDSRVPEPHQYPLPDSLCEKRNSLKTSFFPEISKPGLNACKKMANNRRANDAFENVSNNASTASNDIAQSNLESNSESAQQIRELEREISILVNEEISEDALAEPFIPHLHSTERGPSQINDLLEENIIHGTYAALPLQVSRANINNASSMNVHRGREREYSRRRRLSRDLTPSPIISHSPSRSRSFFEDPQVNGENRDPQGMGSESPMDDGQTQNQSVCSETFQSLNINPNTPLSLPSRSGPLWGNMLSGDPQARKLWSCEDHDRRQYQASQNLLSDQSLANGPRLQNGVPYCPTTENYWQMALNPNASTPSLGFQLHSSITNTREEPPFVGNDVSHNTATEEMVVEGHEISNDLPADLTSYNGSHHFSSFADLFRQFDSLLMRSQNQVSQRLEALGNSLNARLKQLQRFVERHITHRDSLHNSSDDERPSVRKLKHPAIHLKRKASRARRSRNSFPLNMAKGKKDKSDLLQASGEIVNCEENNEVAGASSGWAVFPSIKFKEMESEKNQKFPTTTKNETLQGTGAKQSDSLGRKSVVPKIDGVSTVGAAKRKLRTSSSTCSCNHKHTRSCRRRRGMEGTKCNMCLLANTRGMGRRRRAISANLKTNKKQVSLKKRSAKRNSLKSILKKSTYGRKSKYTRKKSSVLSRRKVRFGKVLHANSLIRRPFRKQATTRQYVSKKRKYNRSISKKERVNSRANVRNRKRSTSIKRRRKPIIQIKNWRKISRKQTKPYHLSNKNSCNINRRGPNKYRKVVAMQPLSTKKRFTLPGRAKRRQQQSKSNVAKLKTPQTATKDIGVSPYCRYKVTAQKHFSNDRTPHAINNNECGYTNRLRLICHGKTSSSHKSQKGLKCKTQNKCGTSIENNSINAQRCRRRIKTSKPQRYGAVTWLRRYENTSNSNRRYRRSQSRKRTKERRKISRRRSDKPSLQQNVQLSPNKGSRRTRGRSMKYLITSTGYSSLIEKLKVKYERMLSMASLSQMHSKAGPKEAHLCRRSSEERLVNQFRRVISHKPASRLNGLKSILSPLDSSAETVCHLPQENIREAQVFQPSSKQVRIRAANVAWGVKECDGMRQHPSPACRAAHGVRFDEHYHNQIKLQACDSPPKLQSLRDYSPGIEVCVSPSDTQNTHINSRHNFAVKNVFSNEEHSSGSSCGLQQVDSIELTRRRLAKWSNDTSRNACCCEFNTSDFNNFSTGNFCNTYTQQPSLFHYPLRMNCAPHCTHFYLLPENFNSQAAHLGCQQPTAISNDDLCSINTGSSSTSSKTSLQDKTGTFFFANKQSSATRRVEKCCKVLPGESQFEDISGSQEHLVDIAKVQGFETGTLARNSKSDTSNMEQEQLVFVPFSSSFQISSKNLKSNSNVSQLQFQFQEQPKLRNRFTNGEKDAIRVLNNKIRFVRKEDETNDSQDEMVSDQSYFHKDSFKEKNFNPKTLGDFNQAGIRQYTALSRDNDQHRKLNEIDKVNERRSSEEKIKNEMIGLKLPYKTNSNTNTLKYVKSNVSGSEELLFLNSCKASKTGEKGDIQKPSQNKETVPIEYEPSPHLNVGQNSNKSNTQQASYCSENPTDPKENSCCELRNCVSVSLNGHSPKLGNINYDMKKDERVKTSGTNDSFSQNLDPFQISRIEQLTGSNSKTNQGRKTNERNSLDPSNLSVNSDEATLKRTHIESKEPRMEIKHDSNEENMSCTNVNEISLDQSQNPAHEYLKQASFLPFEKKGIPQHPYLDVKCPGISTTWVSVGRDGIRFKMSPNDNELETNNQAPDQHTDNSPTSHCEERRSTAEANLNEGLLTEKCMQNVETLAHQRVHKSLESCDSHDLVQNVEPEKPIHNDLTHGSMTSAISKKNTQAEENNIRRQNENHFLENAVCVFETDELIFPVENDDHRGTLFPTEPCESDEAAEPNRRSLAFSVYRQSQVAECLNANATNSSSSSLENNNNAAGSRLMLNISDCLKTPQKLNRNNPSFNSSALPKTCNACMKQGVKCPSQTIQHQHSNCTSPEKCPLQTGEKFELTSSLSPPEVNLTTTPYRNSWRNAEFTGQTTCTSDDDSSDQHIPARDSASCHQKGNVKLDTLKEEDIIYGDLTDREIVSISRVSSGNSSSSEVPVSSVITANDELTEQLMSINSQNLLLLMSTASFASSPLEAPSAGPCSEHCKNHTNFNTMSLQTCKTRNSSMSETSNISLVLNKSFPSVLKEATNPCKSTLLLGKRKRQQECNYLSDSMAPPRKVPRMDPAMKVLNERRKKRVQRRLLWQQRREKKFQALQEEKKKNKLSKRILTNPCKSNDQPPLQWCDPLLKRLCEGQKVHFRYYSSSDADCESS